MPSHPVDPRRPDPQGLDPHLVEKCPYCGKDRTLLTVNEATALATVNRKTIYRWIRNGTLEHCVLPSGAVRVFKDSLIRIPGVAGEHEHEAAPGNGAARPARATARTRALAKHPRTGGT